MKLGQYSVSKKMKSFIASKIKVAATDICFLLLSESLVEATVQNFRLLMLTEIDSESLFAYRN